MWVTRRDGGGVGKKKLGRLINILKREQVNPSIMILCSQKNITSSQSLFFCYIFCSSSPIASSFHHRCCLLHSLFHTERRWSKDKSQKLREKKNHFFFLSFFCFCSHSTEPKHPQLSEAAFLSHSISTITLVLWCVFQSRRNHLYVSNFPSQNDFVSPFFKLSIALKGMGLSVMNFFFVFFHLLPCAFKLLIIWTWTHSHSARWLCLCWWNICCCLRWVRESTYSHRRVCVWQIKLYESYTYTSPCSIYGDGVSH